MRYLKRFNEQEKSIEDWCKIFDITDYDINGDLINVHDDVDMDKKSLSKIPIKFGKVTGNFSCRFNNLSSLKGCPIEVGREFFCKENKLITLEGGPIEVGAGFKCDYNLLTSLEGCPKEVDGIFRCSNNRLTTLIGGPIMVTDLYRCFNNELISLDGLPFNFNMELLNFKENPIYYLFELFGSYKKYKSSLEYEYLDGGNIVKFKFREACEEVGVIMPDSIPGYTYI
jgi:hypothetical protein